MALAGWLQRRQRQKLSREREQFVARLARFLENTADQDDWDRFESARCRDAQLEAMRQSILRYGVPPMDKAQTIASKMQVQRMLDQLVAEKASRDRNAVKPRGHQ